MRGHLDGVARDGFLHQYVLPGGEGVDSWAAWKNIRSADVYGVRIRRSPGVAYNP